jgi:hypothetical protein
MPVPIPNRNFLSEDPSYKAFALFVNKMFIKLHPSKILEIIFIILPIKNFLKVLPFLVLKRESCNQKVSYLKELIFSVIYLQLNF